MFVPFPIWSLAPTNSHVSGLLLHLCLLFSFQDTQQVFHSLVLPGASFANWAHTELCTKKSIPIASEKLSSIGFLVSILMPSNIHPVMLPIDIFSYP